MAKPADRTAQGPGQVRLADIIMGRRLCGISYARGGIRLSHKQLITDLPYHDM